jgi:hypothetical protein
MIQFEGKHEKDLIKKSLKVHSAMRSFCGDDIAAKSKNGGTDDLMLAAECCQMGLDNESLRDELYCQTIKQVCSSAMNARVTPFVDRLCGRNLRP